MAELSTKDDRWMVALVNAANTYKNHPFYDVEISMDAANSELV